MNKNTKISDVKYEAAITALDKELKLGSVDIKGHILVLNYYSKTSSLQDIKAIDWDASVVAEYDLGYSYKYIENGNYPVLAILPEANQYEDFLEQHICCFRKTIKIFLGDTKEEIDKLLKKVTIIPDIYEKNITDKPLFPRKKIIDYERKGHLVKLYLGNLSEHEYEGYDWDEKYHHSYPVHEKYVKKIIYLQLDEERDVFEMDTDSTPKITKYDLKNRKYPFLTTSPIEDRANRYNLFISPNSKMYYFEDKM